MKRNLLVLLLLGGLGALAQVYDNGNGAPMGPGDPNMGAPAGPPAGADANGGYDPSHGVARISVLQGDVSVAHGDSGEVTAAAMNAPLMAQDRLMTAPQGRAEIQLDHDNVLRVAGHSEVRFSDIEYGRYQVQVAAGTVTLTIFGQARTQGEVDTPSVSVRALQPGAYRISVREDGTSEITVRSGEAEIYTPTGTEKLEVGQTMMARGPASDPEFQMTQAIAMDQWDQWNQSRDQQLMQERQQAYQYVSPDINGAEDLEGNGQWVDEQPYGYVWQPNVAPGWAPYEYGRWVDEPWYGWTWISYDPWGWAPYHYGRWFWGTHGWCWYPGGGFHYWSPALVGFFGFGHGGFGVGFGFGNIGWVPLAPFERVHPWWGAYRGRSLMVNNVNVYNSYRNARVSNGVIGMPAAEFGRRGVNGNSVRASAADLSRAGLVRGQLPVAASRESMRMSDRPVSMSQMPRVGNVQFAQHMRASSVSSGRVSSVGQSAAAASHGWGRFGEPIHNSASSAASGFRGGSQSGGWARFGGSQPAANSGALRISPTIGRSGSNYGSAQARSYSAPQRSFGSPSYSAPRSYSYGPAGGYSQSRSYGAPSMSYGSRGYASPSYGGSRSYSAPSSRYGSRSYSAPSRSYSAPSRSYSAPSHSYSAPSHSYSAPRSSGGGGGGFHSSGGGGGGGHHR